MATITVWLMLVASSGYNGPAVHVQFANENDCKEAVVSMEKQTASKKGMPYLYGVCVEAKVVRP